MYNRFIRCLILLLFFSPAALSSTYYIDAVNGNDNNTGLTSFSPWKSIAKVNSFSFSPGDQILLKSGQKWREQLNFPSSGTADQPVIIGSYDSGDKPIISGADIITGFQNHTGNIWKSFISRPQQVFFNEIRGQRQRTLSSVNAEREWFYDTTSAILYIYSPGNPAVVYSSPGVEASVRQNSVYLTQDYITIQNLRFEKTSNSAIKITSFSQNIIVDNAEILQWTDEENWEFDEDGIDGIGGIDIYGSDCEIRNSVFGRNTGNDIADQNWSGFISIHSDGRNNRIHHNRIYHSSTENENRMGNQAFGIRLSQNTSGTTEVHNNYIYHTGSHGIFVKAMSSSGDVIRIYDNTIEYPGQAGISCYKTRKADGVGGTGYIFGNRISFANRLGGDVGGGSNQASGIHMNDGVISGVDPARPFMKWYVFENIVHSSRALMKPNGNDSGGISLDYNANGVEVYRNLVYNNWGKGIYIWNSSRCRIYYNIIYGNDTGTTVSAASNTSESADYNEIYNNTYYKNYNTDQYGPNHNTEIYFGQNGDYNVFKNNIIYGHIMGLVYYFRNVNTTGCTLDNNVVYKEAGNFAWDTAHDYQTYDQWKVNHPLWDVNSINRDPMFVNAAEGDFNLQPESPAINRGADLGFDSDFYDRPINESPDIGAVEYWDATPPVVEALEVLNSNSLRITYSKKVMPGYAETPSNYFINNGVNVNSASLAPDQTEVLLTTTEHAPNQTFTITINNVRDIYGNVIVPPGNSTTYVTPGSANGNSILINANTAVLSGDARLGSKTGMKNTRAVYFQGTNGGASYEVNIPKTGTWYVWARMFYYSSGGKNSFFLNANNSQFVLGDDDSKYNVWHWDGYQSNGINIGILNEGINTIMISGREPGLTLWVDQIILTDDPSYIPTDYNLPSKPVTILLNANTGTLSGDARLGSKNGMKNTRAVYFQGTNGGAAYDVNIPKAGNWYVWARMFYYSSGGKNSFFLTANNQQFILGDDDSKYNVWHWDGYQSKGINIGNVQAGPITILISGREPGLTLWVDQIVITNDPNFIPTDDNVSFEPVVLLINANTGVLTGDARLGSKTGMKNTRAVYFQGTNGGASYNVNIPKAGTWYAWARMFYYSSGGKNSFFFTANNRKLVLGDDDSKYNVWHWDGYNGTGLIIGNINEGNLSILVSGREPGLTLWVDQIVLTNDPSYNPNTSLGKENNDADLAQTAAAIPDVYSLYQNYPNPFNPSTTIRADIPEDAFVTIKVYDILGNELKTLANQYMPAGFHDFKFNAGDLSTGVYIYQIKAGGFIKTMKMQLIK